MGVVAGFGNSYPTDARDGAGVDIEKFGLGFRVSLNYYNIEFSDTAPATGRMVAQNTDGSFTCFDISSLPISPQLINSLLSGSVPAGYPPRRSQFLQAVRASGTGRLAAVRAAVPSNPDDPISIAWQNTLFVVASGRLAQHVKTTLSLSNDDLSTLLNQARTLAD